MKHVAVCGLQFGDEGKGSVIDFFASQGAHEQVIKISGGAQCAHHVVREDGAVHRFAQFGSGTFHGLPTHLSRFFLVDPLRLKAEANALASLGVDNVDSLLTIDERCLVTTPYHAAANRAREVARGDRAHGSCGVGIGETVDFALNAHGYQLRAGDLRHPDILNRKLSVLHFYYTQSGAVDAKTVPTVDELVYQYVALSRELQVMVPEFTKSILSRKWTIFEGSQGVLLDEWYGFHPHTTWANTTFDNAQAILDEAGNNSDLERVGVLRSYTTRHGAGPFPTENRTVLTENPEAHNGTGVFQGAWRAGHFDAVLARYAVDCVGRDGLKIAVTHLDRPGGKFCNSYQHENTVISGLLKPSPVWFQPDVIDIRQPIVRTMNKTVFPAQDRLSKLLKQANPAIHPWPFDDPVYGIRKALDLDVRLMSYGPKASNKKCTLSL